MTLESFQHSYADRLPHGAFWAVLGIAFLGGIVASAVSPGTLLGAQLVGHWKSEISKRVDIFATALYHNMTVESLNELDPSYTPLLSSPWDPVQMAAQAWCRSLKTCVRASRDSAGIQLFQLFCATTISESIPKGTPSLSRGALGIAETVCRIVSSSW